ncbi:MAG: hypothetical protein JXO48_07055 [Deltaproteobacteria bacterium]|nr:hypothetical protein [Deltaproteobacteria bacterium]
MNTIIELKKQQGRSNPPKAGGSKVCRGTGAASGECVFFATPLPPGNTGTFPHLRK